MKRLGDALQHAVNRTALGRNQPAANATRPVTETLTPSGPPSPPSDPTTTARPYCPTCDAAGFVRRRREFGQPDFGRAFPCPACAGDPDENRATLWRLSGIGPTDQAEATFATFNLAVTPSLESTAPADLGQSPSLRPRGRREGEARWRGVDSMRDAFRAAETWADGDGPPFLVLASGDKGIGKTHLAIAAAGRLIARGRVVPRLLDDLRETQRPDAPRPLSAVRDPCIRYPVLILDELGRGRPTDWAETELFTIIDDRYREARRTLVITNGDPDTWDDAIRSRLLDRRRSRVVACQGSDYRLRSTTGTARQDGVERVRGVSA